MSLISNGVDAVRDYRPPLWLVHLLTPRPASVPLKSAGRAVLALAVPLAVGLAFDRPELAAVAATGALPMVLADDGGPYRQRAFRFAAAGLAATAGFAVGLLTLPVPLLAMPVLVLLAVVSVVVGRLATASRIAGMVLLMFGVIGAAKSVPGAGFWVVLGVFLAGVGWSLVVGIAGWAVRGSAPERDAVAMVFVQVAAMLDADDRLTAWAARQQLTVRLDRAYDSLLKARAWMPRRDAAYRELLTVLSQATVVVEAAVAVANAGERVPRSLIDHLTRVAAAVLASATLPVPPPREGAHGPHLAEMYDGLAKLDSGPQRQPHAPRAPREWVTEQIDELKSDRLTVNAMLRLGGCVALAEVIGALLPMANTHWITLTVAIVLRPELGSVFGRTALRGLGTVLGVLAGAIMLLAAPSDATLVALAAVFAAVAAFGKVYSYALLSAAMTPLLLINLDIQSLGDSTVLTDRLTHTIIGCLIVLVFGYWLWPGSLRPRVGGRIATTLVAVRDYVGHGLRPNADQEATSTARRRAYRALAELRTAFSQVIVEPSAAGRQAVAWWPAIVGLERVADAVTEVVVKMRRGDCELDKYQVDGVLDALDEMVDAVSSDRAPVHIRIPDGGSLGDVVDHLRAVLEAIRGPELG